MVSPLDLLTENEIQEMRETLKNDYRTIICAKGMLSLDGEHDRWSLSFTTTTACFFHLSKDGGFYAFEDILNYQDYCKSFIFNSAIDICNTLNGKIEKENESW